MEVGLELGAGAVARAAVAVAVAVTGTTVGASVGAASVGRAVGVPVAVGVAVGETAVGVEDSLWTAGRRVNAGGNVGAAARDGTGVWVPLAVIAGVGGAVFVAPGGWTAVPVGLEVIPTASVAEGGIEGTFCGARQAPNTTMTSKNSNAQIAQCL